MATYYESFDLSPKATTKEVEIAFRRYIARYRPAVTVEGLFTDPRFSQQLNAYLTLRGSLRADYDHYLHQQPAQGEIPAPAFPGPAPLDMMSLPERRFLMAQIALWRRESVEALHLLRGLLEIQPDLAEGWALMGEVYFTVNHLEDGITAYTHAVQTAPERTELAERLQQAQDALAGKRELRIEPSPDEELLREERHHRWRFTAVLELLAITMIGWSFFLPRDLLALDIPWRVVGIQALGTFFVLLGLGYGRFIEPFERNMLWSSIAAGDRGRMRSYPYGLIFAVTGAVNIWLALVAMLITALANEEWPKSVFVLLACCIPVHAGLAYALYTTGHVIPWTTLAFAGNPLLLAALFGWWMGSIGTPTYD